MFKEKIEKALQEATGVKDVILEFPENETFGDYSTNVALQTKSKNPREEATKIVEKLRQNKDLSEIIEKVEVAGPGFINFWLSKEALGEGMKKVISEGLDYGKNESEKGKRIMFEFGQPNTHKLPHIGHLYSYIFGESMSRILVANGATIFRANYQGDVGPHVAKCLWAFEKEKPVVPDSLEAKVDLLQKMYQIGSKAYEEDEIAEREIDKLNVKIYQKDPQILPLWEKTRKWSLDYYKQFETRLGIAYDRAYFESEVAAKGKEKVEENVGKIFKKSRGAIIFEGSKFGLHDRVFVTSRGTAAYEAKDFYLEELKMKEWPFDLLIISTAREQDEYFKVVFKALEEHDPEFVGKLKHVGFGMVNLKTGKMSSRTGQIIGAIDLVNMVVEKVGELGSKGEVAEKVGVGAVKYSFLKNNPLQDTKFDINESIAKEGNSGPYIQYTVARTNSVLAKTGKLVDWSTDKQSISELVKQLNSEEYAVLRLLPRFPEVIEAAAENFSPNLLANYLFSLAQKYNNFYDHHRIIGEEHQEFRLMLTAAAGQILKNGLCLLGIEAPEKM